MRSKTIFWDQDEDPDGNVQHILEHGLTPEDVEYVFQNSPGTGISRSTSRPVVFGETPSGRYIMIAYEEIGTSIIYPVTAYEVPRRK